jgi:diguanylate cyclase (GGDEF)-like protein
LSSERASERLEQLAHTDALTGVGNRLWLTSRLPEHLPAGSAVMLIDLDHFKRTNDIYGHAAGDQVLAACAQCLRSQLRESDVLARFGGEEFIVYLPDTSADAAAATAQRLCDAVARLGVATNAGTLGATISIGLACIRKAGGSWTQWQHLADQALYEAKRQGRNRVVAADQLPPTAEPAEARKP